MLPAQPLQTPRQIRIDDNRHTGSGKRLLGRPRTVRRQGKKGRSAGQGVAPILRLALQPFPRQPLPLPGGIIRVLDRQRRQRIVLSSLERPVKLTEFTHQHAHRPAVRDDMMLGQQEDVLRIRHPDQTPADQRPARKIEWRARLFMTQIQKRRLCIRPVPQIVLQHRQPRIRRQNLNPGLALRCDKDTAQRLMTGKQTVKAALPGGAVEPTTQPQGQRNVIVRAALVQLRQKP
ncbi:hypothetical protein AJ87_00605 [Rhizobium yanglingense]|nr:hypothetical protein AJ87_00605 [Rhizobium yanglingense]